MVTFLLHTWFHLFSWSCGAQIPLSCCSDTATLFWVVLCCVVLSDSAHAGLSVSFVSSTSSRCNSTPIVPAAVGGATSGAVPNVLVAAAGFGNNTQPAAVPLPSTLQQVLRLLH